MSRIACPVLRSKVTSAQEACQFIHHGDNVGMSGFTGAGYPKAVPTALASRIEEAHARGDEFAIGLWTGASTAPDADGVLAQAHGVAQRMPYNSDPTLRQLINSGHVDYVDAHLSHSAQQMWAGFYGNLDVAVVEVTAALSDGLLVPSSSVGNNKTWLEQADKVILEINHWQPRELEGFHDIYHHTALPPHRQPIHMIDPTARIGEPYLHVDPQKVVAVVETRAPDRNDDFAEPDETSQAIADHLVDFFTYLVSTGRMSQGLLPLQSGVGNVANAVLANLQHSNLTDLVAFTEVIQDGMLDLLDSGTLRFASATSFGLSSAGVERFNTDIDAYKGRILLRSEENFQSSRIDPTFWGAGHERHDRSRYVRACQFHPYYGQLGHEWYRRQRRLHPQRVLQFPLLCRWSAMSTTPNTTFT